MKRKRCYRDVGNRENCFARLFRASWRRPACGGGASGPRTAPITFKIALRRAACTPVKLCVYARLFLCSRRARALPLLCLRFAAQVAADARYLRHGPRRVWKSTSALIFRWRASRRGEATFLRVRPARVSSLRTVATNVHPLDVPFSHAPPRCLSSSIAPITSPHYSCHRLYR